MPRYKVTVLVHQHYTVEIDATSEAAAMRAVSYGPINGEEHVVLVDAIDAELIS